MHKFVCLQMHKRLQAWSLLSEKLPLSQKLRHFKGRRFSQCFIPSTSLNYLLPKKFLWQQLFWGLTISTFKVKCFLNQAFVQNCGVFFQLCFLQLGLLLWYAYIMQCFCYTFRPKLINNVAIQVCVSLWRWILTGISHFQLSFFLKELNKFGLLVYLVHCSSAHTTGLSW